MGIRGEPVTAHTANSTYAERHPRWHAQDSGHKARAVWSFAQRLGISPSHVVDVGCGAGGVTARLGHVWPVVEGWDTSAEAIAIAKREHPQCSFTHGAFERSGQRADLILCLDVVEHVAGDVALMKALSGCAEHLIFRVPLDWSVLDACRPTRLQESLDHWGHVQLYDRRLLAQRLGEAGLTMHAITYDRVPPGPPRTWAGHVTGALRTLGDTTHPAPFAWLLGGWSVLVHATRTAPVHATR